MKRVFLVRSMEKSVCPICMGELEIIGSRRRYVIEATGSRQTLVIRRMRCLNNVCGKIHHELPDILVPYKIHAAEILEKIIVKDTQEVPLEESTIHRIRSWFYHRADALVGGLIGVYTVLNKGSGVDLSTLPRSILSRIHFFVDKSSGWLKRLVRILVNNNLWIHTQFV